MRKIVHSIVALLFVTLTSVPTAFGQYPGIIDGQIDIAGDRGPLQNVSVKLVGEESNFVAKLTSDKKGRFAKLGIRPGLYRATLECEGYVPVVVVGMNVLNNGKIKINVKMVPSKEVSFTQQVLNFGTGRVESGNAPRGSSISQ